jgi:hypothetical protein
MDENDVKTLFPCCELREMMIFEWSLTPEEDLLSAWSGPDQVAFRLSSEASQALSGTPP